MRDKSPKKTEALSFFAAIFLLLLLLFLNPGSLLRQEQKEPQPANLIAGSTGEYAAPQKRPGEAKIAPAQPAEKLELETQSELFSREKTFEHNLQVCVQISNQGQTAAAEICLDIPLLGRLDSPYQTLLEESFSSEPLAINEHACGSRSATFKIDSLAPAETKTIILDYLLSIAPWEPRLSSDQATAAPSAARHVDLSYLSPSPKVESSHPEILAAAHRVAGGLTDNLERARALYKFVIAHMQYDFNSPSCNKGALAALRGGAGVCEDYAALFVALCRAEEIPARLVYGYIDPRSRGECRKIIPAEGLPLRGYRHCWAEFYLEELGWLPADPTLDLCNRDCMYFATLPQGAHLAQNYADRPLCAHFLGGELDITWEEVLLGS